MITNQLKETQRNYLMETAKVLFPKKKGCESSAAYRNVVRAADILLVSVIAIVDIPPTI